MFSNLLSIPLIGLFFPDLIPPQYTYVPTYSLRKLDICSIISIALAPTLSKFWQVRVDAHHSRRTMLKYLLSIRTTPDNEHLLKWIEECHPNFNWALVETNYQQLRNTTELYQIQYNAQTLGNYWQLKIPTSSPRVKNAREYISQYRSGGFQPNELKLYWNYDEIEYLTTPHDYNPITDTDSHKRLLKWPVSRRKNSGTTRFLRSGIQDAVFEVPEDNQVIVLDFADERMPGGYFLEGAMTQEEVILYNSDGYRALLDLKYRVMDGGYILPEYGVAYVKHVRFFRKNPQKERLTDLIIGACYDLSNAQEGLYKPPASHDIEGIRSRTRQKLQAVIASAVANTEGDDRKTYLLLGPIGTGAFYNDMKMIAELFYEILNNPLMHSKGPIRYAFEQIWFVSIGSLQTFEEVFEQS